MPCFYDQITEQFAKQKENLKRLEDENCSLKESNGSIAVMVESLKNDYKALQDKTLTLTQGMVQMEYEKELEKLGGNK
ncbi:hypothetical protein [Clostridium merdae]|uniref:hypothetical protein n=1 Tax=Clostridium merdae TaxID=1958780 RepID=UPI000A2701C3|nr:hypothetical protein [Clostridium merdae]